MIAKSLIVNGAARFLNKIYANDLAVAGTTSFTSLAVSGNATVSGTLHAAGATSTNGILNIGNTTQANAILQLNNKKALTGTDSWLRINDTKAFTSGVYFGSSLIRTDGSLQIGNNGSALNFTTSSGTVSVPTTFSGKVSTDNIVATNLQVTDTLRSYKWDIDHVANLGGTFLVTPTYNATQGTATANITAISGNTVTMAITDSTAISGAIMGGVAWAANSKIKITGKIGGVVIGTCDGTLTAQLNNTSHVMNVQFIYPNQTTYPLSVKNYTASEISGLTVMLTTVGATNPVGIYMTARDSNNYSHISLYGGTAVDPTVRIGNLQGLPVVNGEQPSGWGIYTNHGYFDGVIVSQSGKIGNWYIGTDAIYSSSKNFATANNMYFGTSGISLGTTFKVTAAGALTATSGYIGGWTIGTSDLHNGTNSMTSTTVGLYLGTGGIRNYASATAYTNIQNGIVTAVGANVSGTITATAGTIGSNSTAGNRWQIGDKAIYNTTNSMTSTGVGTYIGVDGIRNYKDANTFVNIQNGKITAKAVDLTGKITATEGEIGGASISNGVLQIKDANISGTISGSKITATSISADRLNITDLQAIGASIGGFAIDTTSIHTKNVAVTSNADNSIALSSADFTRTINSTSRAGLRFAIGDKFGVTGDGTIYASSATISGSITATSGTIGGWTANSSYGLYTNSKTTATSTNTGILIQKDGNIYAGAYSSSTEACAFQLLADGSGRIGRYSFATNGEFTTTVSGNTAGMGNASYAFWAGAASSSAASAPFRVAYDGSAVFANATLGDPNSYHVHIDSDSLDIWNGTEANTNNKLASFGENIYIGNSEEGHTNSYIYMDYRNFKMISKEDDAFIWFSDLRDSSGVAEITDTFVGDGETQYFDLSFEPLNDTYVVTQDNETISGDNINLYGNQLSFSTPPLNGVILTVTYSTTDSSAKAITLGIRKPNSKCGATSVAEGWNITASGTYSHAEGWYTEALGRYSHAEGGDTQAIGNNSHAEGSTTIAKNDCSHAEGFKTTASNWHSHAEGIQTIANGYASHAEGSNTKANGGYSHAGGLGTIASSRAQTAIGKYNATVSDALFIVGNGGANSTRSNAFVVNSYGNGIFSGVVKQSKPVITLTRTNNSYVDATSFARMSATQVGNLIVIYGNLRLTASLPATTSADLIQIGTVGCSESIMQGAQVMVPSGNGQPVLISIGTDKKISIYNYGSSAATGWIRFSATIVIYN